ncbi:hypothetical protein ABZP36_000530 [Zizania latifolia]
MSSVPESEPSTFITLSVKHPKGVRITRTMRTTDKLHDLTEFYLTMVPAYGCCAGEGIFMHYGRTMSGLLKPTDYGMEDGDEIIFFPISGRSVFVTLKIKGDDGCSFTRTMRRTDRLQDLIDYYNAMVPIAKNCDLLYNGRQLEA